jgi:membrane fusion protein (multidrug efflux system)
MAAAFPQTLRALAADRPHTSLAALVLAASVTASWAVWVTTAEVSVQVVTERARIEVDQRAHAVDAPMAARVTRVDLELGGDVTVGAPLVELDVEPERRRLDHLRARLAAIEPQIEAVRRELAARERSLGDDERATLAAIDEGRARLDEARVAAHQAEGEARAAATLLDGGAIAELEAARVSSVAEQRRAAASAASLTLERIQREQRTRGSEGLARIEALRRDLAGFEGDRSTLRAEERVIEETIQRSVVRAPVAGKIGEVAPVTAGAYVHAGDRLFSVVPPGDLKAVADYVPKDALGRVREGQEARLRLEGFPWMQYGVVPARVTRVGGELRDGRVRVELAILPGSVSAIPLQHGLPAIAEVDVERLTPARLVLRAIGAELGKPANREAGK